MHHRTANGCFKRDGGAFANPFRNLARKVSSGVASLCCWGVNAHRHRRRAAGFGCGRENDCAATLHRGEAVAVNGQPERHAVVLSDQHETDRRDRSLIALTSVFCFHTSDVLNTMPGNTSSCSHSAGAIRPPQTNSLHALPSSPASPQTPPRQMPGNPRASVACLSSTSATSDRSSGTSIPFAAARTNARIKVFRGASTNGRLRQQTRGIVIRRCQTVWRATRQVQHAGTKHSATAPVTLIFTRPRKRRALLIEFPRRMTVSSTEFTLDRCGVSPCSTRETHVVSQALLRWLVSGASVRQRRENGLLVRLDGRVELVVVAAKRSAATFVSWRPRRSQLWPCSAP